MPEDRQTAAAAGTRILRGIDLEIPVRDRASARRVPRIAGARAGGSAAGIPRGIPAHQRPARRDPVDYAGESGGSLTTGAARRSLLANTKYLRPTLVGSQHLDPETLPGNRVARHGDAVELPGHEPAECRRLEVGIPGDVELPAELAEVDP